MSYCEHCGTANDILSSHCHRCGQPLAQDAFAGVPAAQVPESAIPPSAALGRSDMSGPALGATLDLPDWLTSTAGATQESPGTAPRAHTMPPAELQFAPPSSNIGTNELFSPRPAAAEPPVLPAPPAAKPAPLPPVPSGNLSDSLPEWLRQPATPRPGPAQRSPALEPANPATFISENDLPEWIRQIAAADEAKRRDEERIAAEAALARETAKRAALPGETAPATVANPWLARRDQAAPAQAWGPAHAAGAPTPRPSHGAATSHHDEPLRTAGVDPDLTVPAAASGHKAKLAKPTVSAPKLSLPKLNLPSASLPASREAAMRAALLGAALLLLLVVIVALAR